MTDGGDTTQGPVLRAIRLVMPWLALAVLVWILAGMWGSFRATQRSARDTGTTGASTAATSTQPSAATTVTGLAATALQDVKMRQQADLSSSVVATAKQGSKLAVLAKQGLFLRVRDSAGHIGWVPNDVQYLQVTTSKQ